jgi:predicted dehydrogenase
MSIGFIGAGSYAQSYLLPNIPKGTGVSLKGVMTASGTSSRSVAERFGFEFCTADEKDILESEDINTIFITTRHDSHGDYVLKALKTGKHVFVEKPLCLREEELESIREVYSGLVEEGKAGRLMVGYNRRFSQLVGMAKNKLGSGRMAMIYRVNAGQIPAESWIQDKEFGGGRILGEVCHFVDLLTFVAGSLPDSVFAAAMQAPQNLEDTLSITLTFQNGSIGTICYLANGDKSLPKEMLEVFARGSIAVLNDFRSTTMYGHGRKQVKRLMSQDKGQKQEVRAFIDCILQGHSAPIPFDELYSASLVTFKIIESLRMGQAVRI